MSTPHQVVAASAAQFYRFGFLVLIAVIFGLMWFAALVDLIQTFRKHPTIGDFVNGFVAAHPWAAALLAFGFGALIAHFFLRIDDGY